MLEFDDEPWWPLQDMRLLQNGLSGGYRACQLGLYADKEDLWDELALEDVRVLVTTRSGSVSLGLPGGKVEPWDGPGAAALERETAEETGLMWEIAENAVHLGHIHHSQDCCEVFGFVVEGLRGLEGQELRGVEDRVRGRVMRWGDFLKNTFDSNRSLGPYLSDLRQAVRLASNSA